MAAISAANRQSGGEDWGRALSWKIPEFYSVGAARSKTALFRVLWYPSTVLRTAYRKQFYPKPMIPMESRDAEGCPFAGLVYYQAFGRYCEWCRKVVTWPSRKLKIYIWTHIENSLIFQKCYSFRSTTKNNEVIAESRFRTVASPGACGVFSTLATP